MVELSCFSVFIFQPSVIPSIWNLCFKILLISHLGVEQIDHVPVWIFFFLLFHHLSNPSLIDINLLPHVGAEIRVFKADTVGKELLVVLTNRIPRQVSLNYACKMVTKVRNKIAVCIPAALACT